MTIIQNKIDKETGLMVIIPSTYEMEMNYFMNDSQYYCEKIQDGCYMFPSPESEYDILENELRIELGNYNIFPISFEGL